MRYNKSETASEFTFHLLALFIGVAYIIGVPVFLALLMNGYIVKMQSKTFAPPDLMKFGVFLNVYNPKYWYKRNYPLFQLSMRLVLVYLVCFYNDDPEVILKAFAYLMIQNFVVFLLARPFKETIFNAFAAIGNSFMLLMAYQIYLVWNDHENKQSKSDRIKNLGWI